MDIFELGELLDSYDNDQEDQKHLAAVSVVVAELEERFADRGLKFSHEFYGAMPVQAFGWVDGERFYFRFRRNTALLVRGMVDEETAQRIHDQHISRFPNSPHEIMTNDSVQALPHRVSAEAEINKVTDEPLLGFLQPQEMSVLFVKLMDILH